MKGLLILHAIFCLTILAACGLSRGTYEPLRSYVLEIEEGGEALEIGQSRPLNLPTLLVSLPQPAPGFESQRMVYEQVPYELGSFARPL
jgi:hypothetical protein